MMESFHKLFEMNWLTFREFNRDNVLTAGRGKMQTKNGRQIHTTQALVAGPAGGASTLHLIAYVEDWEGADEMCDATLWPNHLTDPGKFYNLGAQVEGLKPEYANLDELKTNLNSFGFNPWP
jgi:hypothetical protein